MMDFLLVWLWVFLVGFFGRELVIAGLDPAIHRLRKSLAKRMDARIT
jgi:hypothetical protein